MVYTLRFFFSFQNAVCFIILTYLVPVLFKFCIQGVLKLKKLIGRQKVKGEGLCEKVGEALCIKCSRYRPGVAQRVGRGIALLFHDRSTRRW